MARGPGRRGVQDGDQPRRVLPAAPAPETLGGSHLPLLTGFEAPQRTAPDAVVSLDWCVPDGRIRSATAEAVSSALVDARRQAEEAASAALASSPRRLAAFRRLLADAQHLVPLREEQVGELTLPWPVMRRAVVRIGEALVARGIVGDGRRRLLPHRERRRWLRSLDGHLDPGVDVAARRATARSRRGSFRPC